MPKKDKMTYNDYKKLIGEKNYEIQTLKDENKQLEEINDELTKQLKDIERQL